MILDDLLRQPRERRRLLLSTCIFLAVISFLGLLSSAVWTSQPTTFLFPDDPSPTPTHPALSETNFDSTLLSSNFINGSPTPHFRDNLRPNMKYITSWISAGWTNDVMTYMNLIYLGIITERIPVIPMFTPTHIGGHVPPINFGEVFDIPRLSKALRIPIVEWHEIKNLSAHERDEIGCWSVWQAVQEREPEPRNSFLLDLLTLDISYTKAPTWIKLLPHFQHDPHASFWSLASLAFPEIRADNLLPPMPSRNDHVILPPDEQLLCYDYLYYVCANQPYEFDFDYSPAWRFVGQHMHWTPKLEHLRDEYVRKAIGLEEAQATPPWIAIHIRHGDFATWCTGMALSDCFAPISVIARRVEEVKKEILDRKGISVQHVVMTSDEKNATWWEEVTSQGWYKIDHSNTAELHGGWFPVLIDAAIQSGGLGFVGTDRSTMSILARRRTQSWQDGPYRIVRWGKLGADDH